MTGRSPRKKDNRKERCIVKSYRNRTDPVGRFEEAVEQLGRRGALLHRVPTQLKAETQEIRFRVHRPVTLCTGNRTWFLTGSGALVPQASSQCPTVGVGDMQELFRTLCADSIYSREEEIREGYLTLQGGHRAGICGTAAVRGGEIISLRDITSICVRIARETPGAADEFFHRLGKLDAGLLIAGPPSSGKTTVLRDLARQLADGSRDGYRKVAVVDERGELGSAVQGGISNDLGVSCDLLNGYPKAQGILQAVRVLSPEYIICDELGGSEDAQAVEAGMFSGAVMIATVHAGSREELLQRPVCRRMLETGAFGHVALLYGRRQPGKIAGIYKVGDLLGKDRGADSVGGSLCRYRAGGVA